MFPLTGAALFCAVPLEVANQIWRYGSSMKGARLVADDLCALVFDRPHVIAVPPEHFSGCIEVRGLGILPVPSSGPVPVFLVCDLTLEGESERLPDPDYCDFCHVAIRLIRANCFRCLPLHVFVLLFVCGFRSCACRVMTLPSAHFDGFSSRRRLVIVTGLSGAGRSTTFKALEDLDYEVMDNVPLILLWGLWISISANVFDASSWPFRVCWRLALMCEPVTST